MIINSNQLKMKNSKIDKNNKTDLENASDEVKLAVDLIYLLESSQIDPKIALQAIEIVKKDLQLKVF